MTPDGPESEPGRRLTVVPPEKPPRVRARVAASNMVPAIIGGGGSVAASGLVASCKQKLTLYRDNAVRFERLWR